MKTLVAFLTLIFSMILVTTTWAGDSEIDLNLSPVDAAQQRDALVDRGTIFFQHADTIGAGNTVFSDVYFGFMGITHAPDDKSQFSIHSFPPVVEDMPLILFGSGKRILSRSSQSVTSFVGDVLIVSPNADLLGGFYRLGFSGDRFFGEDGSDSLHWNLSGVGLFGDNVHHDVLETSLFFGAIGITHRPNKKLALVLETFFFVVRAEGEWFFSFDAPGDGGFLLPLSYGIRFTGGAMSADVMFLKPIGVDTGRFIMGIPYLSMAFRW